MGFPLPYTEVFLPKIIIQTLSLLGFIGANIFSLITFLGLSHFLEPAAAAPPDFPENHPDTSSEPPVSAILIRELLPAMRYSNVDSAVGTPSESCAVCLNEFEGGDEIRRLMNCKHIFHRSCLDRWMDHDRKTCPLCRIHLVPLHLLKEFNQRLWEDSYANLDFFTEDNVISSF